MQMSTDGTMQRSGSTGFTVSDIEEEQAQAELRAMQAMQMQAGGCSGGRYDWISYALQVRDCHYEIGVGASVRRSEPHRCPRWFHMESPILCSNGHSGRARHPCMYAAAAALLLASFRAPEVVV